jgi:hypothetical protein
MATAPLCIGIDVARAQLDVAIGADGDIWCVTNDDAGIPDATRGSGPSIPPEQLLRALLIHVLYSVRSERLLCEQLEYNLLFRWFVGLGMLRLEPPSQCRAFIATGSHDRSQLESLSELWFYGALTHRR